MARLAASSTVKDLPAGLSGKVCFLFFIFIFNSILGVDSQFEKFAVRGRIIVTLNGFSHQFFNHSVAQKILSTHVVEMMH